MKKQAYKNIYSVLCLYAYIKYYIRVKRNHIFPQTVVRSKRNIHNNPLTLEKFIKEFSKIPRDRESRQQFCRSQKVTPAQRRGWPRWETTPGGPGGSRSLVLWGSTTGKTIDLGEGAEGTLIPFWLCFGLSQISVFVSSQSVMNGQEPYSEAKANF